MAKEKNGDAPGQMAQGKSMAQVTANDLRIEVEDIRERYRGLKDDDLFVAWFMKCFVTDTEEEGVASLVGGPKDKSLDAVHIAEAARKVYLIQGKYHQKLSAALEKRNDVLAFADLARCFTDEEAYRTFRKDLAPGAAGKADDARNRIKTRDYSLQLYFVTTGKCSPVLAREAVNAVRRTKENADIDFIDGVGVLRLLADYLAGVAPPVPRLEFEIESGKGVVLSGVLQRFDSKTKIESWVVPVNVDQIARMYESAGVRLFARNVRGFLGDTQINRNMQETLEREPEYFWYYNNGVTIVCDSAEQVNRGGTKLIRLINPQVINGQQTTRTLHEAAVKNGTATVLVRVISVPRDTAHDDQRFENLVSRIVGATNWQNAIRPSDLMSNDRRQIEIERNLRKFDYLYLRKRQTKGEAKRQAGVKHRFIITKEELAQVVAACDLDPIVVREGKEQLFEERYYGSVFPTSDSDYYLARYWLGKHVSQQAKGFPERAYAKWVVLHFIWQRLSRLLTRKASKRAFCTESERGLFPELSRAVDIAYKSTSAYYRTNRGLGDKQADPSVFYKRSGHHAALEEFWQSSTLQHRSRFDKAFTAFARTLSSIMEK